MLEGDHDAAEDVTSEAIERAVGAVRTGRYEERSSLTPWLNTILRNSVFSYGRYKTRHAHVSIDAPVAETTVSLSDTLSSPGTFTDAVHERIVFLQCMDALPEDDRAIFVICHFQGCPAAATALGLLESTTKSRYRRILNRLARCMDVKGS
jgi:RNA polymerase sigma factor (sigma-70 family)